MRKSGWIKLDVKNKDNKGKEKINEQKNRIIRRNTPQRESLS